MVEKYAKRESWVVLSQASTNELATDVAGLPSELPTDGEDAKRFDLLLLNLQIARLRAEPRYHGLCEQVKAIAGLLEERSAIPMVRERMALIQDLQTDEWWQDVTVPMLETVRRRLRDLVKLIEKSSRKPIYTDFEDELGAETGVALPGFDSGMDFAKFRAKAQVYLRAHQDHLAIRKLRMNRPLTITDIAELERMLAESGVATPAHLAKAATESRGLGVFVRSLVGLDREAAKEALGAFTAGTTFAANQIEFVNLVVDHLTEHGVLDAARLYESPFTDRTPRGPDALFTPQDMDRLIAALHAVRDAAVAA